MQEQVHNGDLAARLDDAHNILRDQRDRQRYAARCDGRAGRRTADPDDEISGPRAIPAGRSSRKPRKPPAASIPGGDLDDLPTASDEEEKDNKPSPSRALALPLGAGPSPRIHSSHRR